MEPLPSVPQELQLHGAALRALAAALVGGDHADDLVQDTALRALRAPVARTATLGGFLATILRNLARSHRRHERRRQERERLVARPEALPATDELAAHHEVLRRVSAAVFALVEPYRITLLLRYFDDLTPTVIAARTAVPLATVKSRLQRGLGLLRAELDRDRDVDWRAALMAAADMTPKLWLLRALHMPTTPFLAAATILGAALLLLPFGRPEPLGPAPGGPGVAAERSAALDPQPAVAREALPDASAAAPQGNGSQLAPALAMICGRCVDAETGKPIAGARATLLGGPTNDEVTVRFGPARWREPEPARTDGEGRFAIPFDPPQGFQYYLEIAAEGRVPRTARWNALSGTAFEPGQIEDLGPIQLVSGQTVRGKVVDAAGAPVAHAGVSLVQLPLPLALHHIGARNSLGGESDERGEFEIRAPVPIGSWAVSVGTRGLDLVGPDNMTVQKGQTQPLTVVVRRMPSVTGIVVDETGIPVSGIRVEMVPERSDSFRMASGRSRADGTFEIFAVRDEAPRRLAVRDAESYLPWQGPRAVAWGARDLRVEVVNALSCQLTVVTKDTGQPVEAYALRCHPAGGGTARAGLRLGGKHPRGVVAVDCLLPGDQVLRVYPNDPSLQSSELVRFTAREGGTTPLRVELERRPTLAVRLQRATGKPVVGSVVELVWPGEAPVPAAGRLMQELDLGSAERTLGPGMVLSCARTGSDGCATLSALKERDHDLVLRVRGRSHVPLVVAGVSVAEAQRELQVVGDGTTLVGLVTPAAARQLALAVELHQGGQLQQICPVTPEGTFRFDQLAAGSVDLVLKFQRLWQRDAFGLNTDVPLVRQPVRLEGKAEQNMELDASEWLPARLEGLVTLDGKAPAAARVMLVGRTAASPPLVQSAPDGLGRLNVLDFLRRGGVLWYHGQFVLDDKGRFAAEGLLPGIYQAQLLIGDDRVDATNAPLLDEELELVPGSSVVRELRFKKP